MRADVIDGSEFPHLAQKYAVMGVPKVIINEKIEFVGAFNEDLFAEHVLLGAFRSRYAIMQKKQTIKKVSH
jgi:hypothetical protein